MANPSELQHSSDDESSSTHSTVTDTAQSSPKSKRDDGSRSTKKSKQSPGVTDTERDIYRTHADQIRQNAIQLLNTEVSPTSNRYRSYHEGPTAASALASDDMDGASLPPWTNTTQSSYEVDNVLSVSQVASMAFNCITHCLTEGYRAASNYYSIYEQSGAADGGRDHNYSMVGGESGNIDGRSFKSSYQDGYQQQMDRGYSNNQSSGQGSTEQAGLDQTQLQGEYTTVSMPSTYQGGNK